MRWAWRAPDTSRPRDIADEQRLVARLTKLMHLSGDPEGQCLARSLVLYGALSRRGADPRFVIGFRRERESMIGHAWVEVDGAPVDEPAALIDALTPTCTYGRDGKRLTSGDAERRA